MDQRQSAPVSPLVGAPGLKYFLDRSGVTTKRMDSGPGKGHYEIAQAYVGADAADLYAQMAKLGFARVQETDTEIHVEAKNLTTYQKRYLKQRSEDTGLKVILNSQQFLDSKDPRAATIVEKLLA